MGFNSARQVRGKGREGGGYIREWEGELGMGGDRGRGRERSRGSERRDGQER